MSYTSYIASVGTPEHHWTHNNIHTDEIGSATTSGSGVFAATPITTNGERTYSISFDNDGERTTCSDQTDMNTASNTQRRSVGGWFMMAGEYPTKPVVIWKEGGTNANIMFFIGYGGMQALQIIEDSPSWYVQGFGLVTRFSRPYHLLMTFSGSNYDDEVMFYVDGVASTAYLPADQAPGQPSLFTHSDDITWGDPSTNMSVAGTSTAFSGLSGGDTTLYLADWASWYDEILTPTQIRGLFEAGAKPHTVISTGTESAMQTSADALGALPNYPLCLEIEDVTGGGDLNLTLDDVTFDDLASLHIRWAGTGTLYLTLTGTSNPDTSLFHTPNSGTISIVDVVTVKVTAVDTSGSPVAGARVYLEAGSTGPLTQGDVILNGITNASGIVQDLAFIYTADQSLQNGKIRKGSAAPRYAQSIISGTIGSSGFDATVTMVSDE